MQRGRAPLFPPCHQKCSLAASVRHGFLTEKVQQGAGQAAFFERSLDRALADGIPSHREPSSFPTDPLHVSPWHFWCLGDRGWVAVQASPLWRGRPSCLPPIRTSSIERDGQFPARRGRGPGRVWELCPLWKLHMGSEAYGCCCGFKSISKGVGISVLSCVGSRRSELKDQYLKTLLGIASGTRN